MDERFQFLQFEPGKWHSLTDKQHLDYRRKARSLATFEKAYVAKYVTATTGTGTHSTASQSALTVDIAIGSTGRVETEGLLRIVPSSSQDCEISPKYPEGRTISPSAIQVSLSSVPEKLIGDVWSEAGKLLNNPFEVMRAAGGNQNARSVASTHGPPH